MKPQITEAQFERIADRIVQTELDRDRAYRNAASNEQAARREAEITERVCAYLYAKYEVSP